MGWSHHWRRPTELPKEPFALAVQDIRKVLKATGVPLAGFSGEGEPILTDDAVVFNGPAGACCEPFEIHPTEFDRRGRDTFWSFCKTEHAPYDICVQAALIALKHHLGEAIIVGSDGDDEGWANARRLCHECLGYGEDFRLSRDSL